MNGSLNEMSFPETGLLIVVGSSFLLAANTGSSEGSTSRALLDSYRISVSVW